MRRAKPRCAVRPQKRRIFFLQSARAFFGGIFQKPTTRAAPTLAIGREKAATAIGELAKSAENKTNNRVRLGSIPFPEL
jgi:hypothetical protein